LKQEQEETNFAEVVNVDRGAFEQYIKEDIAERFGEGEIFGGIIIAAIFLNSFILALQTDLNIVCIQYFDFVGHPRSFSF
jgi:hypothetical protein